MWRSCKGRTVQRIHVWERDRAEPGEHGFEPAITPAAIEAHRLLLRALPDSRKSLAKTAGDPTFTRPERASWSWIAL